MSLEDNKALLVRYFNEIWNDGNTDTAHAIISTDFKTRFTDNKLTGADALLFIANERKKAFPDLYFEINTILAEGDTVFVHYTFTGTHLGEFWGIKPTGKRVEYDGVAMFKIIEGKVWAIGSVRNTMEMLEQVGAIPVFEKDLRQ